MLQHREALQLKDKDGQAMVSAWRACYAGGARARAKQSGVRVRCGA